MQAVEFHLNPSKKTAYFFNVIYFLAVLYLISWPIYFLWKGLILVFIVQDWRKNFNQHARKLAKNSIIRVWQDSKKRWGYENKEGLGGIGKLQGDSFKSSYFIILRIKSITKVQTIFIPRDTLSDTEFRILSSRLMIR